MEFLWELNELMFANHLKQGLIQSEYCIISMCWVDDYPYFTNEMSEFHKEQTRPR